MSGRDEYIDFVRGGMIILMILGHIVSGIDEQKVLFNFIYSFHMPVLFFISAYIDEKYKDKYSEKIISFLVHRFVGIMIPYFFWTALTLMPCSIILILKEFCGRNGSILWFLPVLFILKIIHSINWKINSTNIWLSVLIYIAVIGILGALYVCTKNSYFRNALSYSIPYYFGIWIIDSKKLLNVVISKYTTSVAIILYIVLFNFFDFDNAIFYTQIIRIALSVAVIIIIIAIREQLEVFICKEKVVRYIGRNTLSIYILNGFFLKYVGYRTTEIVLLDAVIYFFLSVFICLLCCAIKYLTKNVYIIRRLI